MLPQDLGPPLGDSLNEAGGNHIPLASGQAHSSSQEGSSILCTKVTEFVENKHFESAYVLVLHHSKW